MWYVGQKVVCIKEPNDTVCIAIKINQIFTIRSIFIGIDINQKQKEGLRFQEIVNEKTRTGVEKGYNSTHFKPLVEKKTDISIFTEMLNKPPAELKKSLKELEKVS